MGKPAGSWVRVSTGMGAGTARDTRRLHVPFTIHHHGFPEAIVSYHGPIFISSFFTNLIKLCHVKMKLSIAYHPQMDGLTGTPTRLWKLISKLFVHTNRTIGLII